MVSFDCFRQQLQSQLDAATVSGAIDVLVNAGDLYRSVDEAPGVIDGMLRCCDAMQAAIRIGDTLVVADHYGSGMTVCYQSPRDEIENEPFPNSIWH
jgi:hypothetical protein